MKFQAVIIRLVHLIVTTYSQELQNSHLMAAFDSAFETSSNTNIPFSENFTIAQNFSQSSTLLPFSFDLLKDIKIENTERIDNSTGLTITPSDKTDNVSSAVDLPTMKNNLQELTTNGQNENQTEHITENDTNITLASSNITSNDVVSPTNETAVTFSNAVIRQTLVWLNDSYTVALLIPVSAGLVIASTIIVTVAACKCIRRRCYRRRLRRKILPADVKNMRPSDRARLLAETSDDEF